MEESGAYLPWRVAEFDAFEKGWPIMVGDPGSAREHMVAWVPDLLGPTAEREEYAREIVRLRDGAVREKRTQESLARARDLASRAWDYPAGSAPSSESS